MPRHCRNRGILVEQEKPLFVILSKFIPNETEYMMKCEML
ncbi:hypothetical protein B4113_2456 [Geobacillus sp. B4113_201601]|nr:hypothetical protein B4113_2456 [Geobacillus sp. B4113_201601]